VTEFHFEFDFRAPSPAVIFEGYFDAALQAEQDRRVDVAERQLLELEDGPDTLRRVCRVVPRRQLPAIIRPFIPGDLSFTETITWRKAEDLIEMRIDPAILGGRVEILATYRVVPVGPGVMRRSFDGRVSAQVRLVGGRIERTVVEDLGRSLTLSASCTQEWLDSR
jgi:hypothetical protein